MMEWFPIDSAPRDGTEFLVWYAGDERARYPEKAGHRIARMSQLNGEWFPLVGCTIFSHDWEQFTHWLPLPNPPQATPVAQTPVHPTHGASVGAENDA